MTTVEALTASKNTLTAIQQMEDVMKASDKLLEGQDTPLMEAREVSIVMEMLHNRARRYQTVASAGMWGLSIKTKERLDPKAGRGLQFGVVVTLKEMNGKNRIDDFIKMCMMRGWVVTRLDVHTQVDVYVKAEEEITFE